MLVDQLMCGVMARSSKKDERRQAIHPAHLERIDAGLRRRLYLEHGYGERFGISDEQLAPLVGGLGTREALLADCDVILLAKPLAEDLGQMRPGQVLWGWPHCVQDRRLTQVAIDRRLTLIAFEAMNHWAADGSFTLHVFHKNNELAGYCSVLHAMALIGSTGNYGRRLRAAVVGFGATARGAVTALSSHGVHDVDVLSHRGVAAVASPIPSARILTFGTDRDTPRGFVLFDGGRVPLPGFLGEHDCIVNCVLQDTDAPLTFLTDEDLPLLAPGSLVIDVSCDEGMGFSWARPTTFAEPTVMVGDHVTYYAVDHSPSYLWNSASWEISEALLPHLWTVMAGPSAWDADQTVRRAIEIRDGIIQNPRILSFQHRMPEYPHPQRPEVGEPSRRSWAP
jgi:alanine dehydrogenase